ncbi:hypothetical protein LCGC14_1530540 [marine sediment metagenome]|uniref:Uncharacterized protein n=1 Tax=marine sediment metagenome TaxID=412755 RepID=A0A0F9LWX3_9ZZZZ
MNFITREQVKEAAAQGVLAALKCCLAHHEQGRDADWVELREAIKAIKFSLSSGFCASCRVVGSDCEKCLLKGAPAVDRNCCDGKWDTASMHLTRLCDDYSNANFVAFQEAEAEVCKYIKKIIKQEEAKECKCKKPELRHGDYGVDCQNNGRIALFYCSQSNTNRDDYTQIGIRGDEAFDCIGNIFDDLKRNSENLRAFTHDRTSYKLLPDGRIQTRHDGRDGWMLNSPKETYQKLGQLIATVERRKKK